MTRQASAASIVFALATVMTLSCMTRPAANPPAPSGSAPPTPAAAPSVASTATPGRAPGARGAPLSDSARARRDSLNAAERDSLMKEVLKSIAGQENVPAESVFMNIKIFKGVPAARVVRIMGAGFSPALGVSCGFCHVVGEYDKDTKQPKETARVMYTMVTAINRDYISKVPVREGRPAPVVNCSTCHRGMIRPGSGPPGASPPRPGAQ